MIKKTIRLNVESDEAVQSIENVDKALDNTKDSQDDLTKSTLASAKSFTFMGVSIDGVSKALKFLKISLIATGIGAIVVAIGTLASAFLSTQKGVDALNSVLIPLGEVLDTIWGIAQKLGDGLFSIVKGNITEGFNTMAGAVENLGDQMDEAWKNGKRLHEIQIEIQEGNVNQGLVISRLNRQAADGLEIAEDVNKTMEERRAAFISAIAAEKAITILKQKQNDLLVEEAERKNRANNTDREAAQALNDVIARGEDLQSEGIKKIINLQKRLNALKFGSEEGIREREEIVNPITGLTNTELSDTIEEQGDLIKGGVDDIQKYTIEGAKQTAKQTAAVELFERKEKQKRDLQSAQFALQIAGDLTFALGSLAKEGSEEQKRLRIAGAIIDTLAGGVAGMLAGLSVGGPWGIALGIATSAAVLASGYASIKKMSQEGATQPQAVQIDTSAPAQIQSPDFNIVGTSDTNQLANTINGQQQQPIKAYVVAGDVTTQQSMDRQIVETASFG